MAQPQAYIPPHQSAMLLQGLGRKVPIFVGELNTTTTTGDNINNDDRPAFVVPKICSFLSTLNFQCVNSNEMRVQPKVGNFWGWPAQPIVDGTTPGSDFAPSISNECLLNGWEGECTTKSWKILGMMAHQIHSRWHNPRLRFCPIN